MEFKLTATVTTQATVSSITDGNNNNNNNGDSKAHSTADGGARPRSSVMVGLMRVRVVLGAFGFRRIRDFDVVRRSSDRILSFDFDVVRRSSSVSSAQNLSLEDSLSLLTNEDTSNFFKLFPNPFVTTYNNNEAYRLDQDWRLCSD
jgi:hypothetical protein